MGLADTTTNLSYARNELIKVGTSFIFDKVGDMIYYMLANNDITFAETQEFTLTDETATPIALTAYVDQGVDYSGFAVGVFGKTHLSGTTGSTSKNALGGCFEIKYTSTYALTGMGLAAGMYIGAYSDKALAIPNSCLVIEAIPGTGVDFSEMPLMVLMNSGAGTAPNIAIEFGHHAAGKTVSATNSDDMYYNNTLRVKVNNADRYIPLSTAAGTFTFNYPIALTNTLTVGVTGTGHDVKVWGDTTDNYFEWDADANRVNIVSTDALGSGYGIKIVNLFTKIGVTAHKGVQSEITYTPSATGTACPIGVVGKVTLNGNLTCNEGSGWYPGMGWGVQGQMNVAAGATLNSAGYGDPSSIWAGVRASLTDDGTTATYTRGVLCNFFGDIQMSQDASQTNFKVYGLFLYPMAMGGVTDVDALIMLDASTTHGSGGATIDAGIIIAAPTTVGIDIEPSSGTTTTGIDIGTVGTGINLTGTQTTGITTGSSVGIGLNVDSTTASTAVTNGAVVIDGGLGVAGRGNFAGKVIITCAAPTAAINAIAGLATPGATWASGEVNGVYGKTTITLDSDGSTYSAAGGHFELQMVGNATSGLGLLCGAMVKFTSDLEQPNAILYLESYPTGSCDMSETPFITFCDYKSGSGVKSNTLVRIGDPVMAQTISTGDGKLSYNQTLRCSIYDDTSSRAIYLVTSSAQGTYTTAYPIVSTYAGTAVDISPTLSTATNGMLLTVTETGTHTSGVKGFKVAMTKMSGAITTSSGAMSGISAEVQARANAANVYAYNAYTGINGSPTLGYMSAFHCYCDDLGSATANYYTCADLNIDSTNEASSGNYFIRMYAHGGAPTAAFYFPSATGIDNLIYFEQFVTPLSTGSGHTTNDVGRIAIKVGATVRYLHYYSD